MQLDELYRMRRYPRESDKKWKSYSQYTNLEKKDTFFWTPFCKFSQKSNIRFKNLRDKVTIIFLCVEFYKNT